MKIAIICTIFAYFVCNLITSKLYNAKEMKRGFVDGQCVVGKICANLFYAPAWLLKGLRFVVMSCVK